MGDVATFAARDCFVPLSGSSWEGSATSSSPKMAGSNNGDLREIGIVMSKMLRRAEVPLPPRPISVVSCLSSVPREPSFQEQKCVVTSDKARRKRCAYPGTDDAENGKQTVSFKLAKSCD